ncbi:MAG: hypothetical protein ACRC6I_13525, partial [Paracoccaceae bacterium]
MRARTLALLALLATPLATPFLAPLYAQTAEAPAAVADRIIAAMQIGPMLDVMHAEGLAYGEDLADDMLGGPDDRWTAIIARLYDRAEMQTGFTERFATELATRPEELPAIETFFASEQGQRILTLEIEARRAMLDEAVEEA